MHTGHAAKRHTSMLCDPDFSPEKKLKVWDKERLVHAIAHLRDRLQEAGIKLDATPGEQDKGDTTIGSLSAKLAAAKKALEQRDADHYKNLAKVQQDQEH